MLFFKDIFSKEQLEEKTRRMYEAYKLNSSKFSDVFETELGISKKLSFSHHTDKQVILRLLGEYYKNEYFIKTMFLDNVLIKRKTAISGLELPVLESRADIVSINGKSIAYEIKTEFDTFQRLDGQLNDYSKCFEYVYVICPRSSLEKLLEVVPAYCGVYIYSDRYNATFTKAKEAELSPNLDARQILDAMLLSDLDLYFKTRDKEKIVQENDLNVISKNFKDSLKHKYKPKWDAYKQNHLTKDFE